MPSDTEPRYRLVDSNGNVVGSLYAEADGTLKLQEGTSGSDNEVSIATDGTFTAPAVSTEKIGGDHYYASAFNGADADARLENALSALGSGHTLFLEGEDYAANRTISQSVTFVAAGSPSTNATRVSGDWTVNERCHFHSIRWEGDLTITSGRDFHWVNGSPLSSGDGSITIEADDCLIESLGNTPVTFASGTSGSLIDSCINVSVTDNGSNTVGNIS